MTGGRERIWPRVVGVFLLAVPFLPLRRLFGPLDGAGALIPPSEWALGLAIFGVSAWLVALLAGRWLKGIARLDAAVGAGDDTVWLAGGLVVLAGLLIAASTFAFRHSPHLIDSVVQLFQAKIFATGTLAAPPPADEAFFATQHMIVDADGWYSQYPPGHAALLSIGALAGAPWVPPVILSLGTAVFIFLSVRRIYGQACARLTLVLLVLCPFFWFMGASFMNHVSALFFLSLFLYLFARWEEEGGVVGALAAGAALGTAALSRPLTAVAVALPFAGFALASTYRPGAGGSGGADGASEPRGDEADGEGVESSGQRGGRAIPRFFRALGPLTVAGIGFAALASLYLLYNAEVTGDPFLPGYLKLWGESHGLGFHETPWGGEHTPLTGLRNELLDLSLLNLFLFEWPVPALLPVGILFVAGWSTEAWDRRLAVAFLTIPAAYFFYWHRDSFLGPRFLYSGVAFLLPLTAHALLEIGGRLRGLPVQLDDLFRPVDAGRWAGVVLLLCVGYGVAYGIPQRFRVYATGMSSMKADIREQAGATGVEKGLIFVKVSWGNRIIARLRGSGVPAPMVERLYRSVPHCRLHGILEQARQHHWEEGRLRRELSTALKGAASVEKTRRLNGDPTLRIRASGPRLTEECRREIQYDRSGYTNFSPHLPGNTPRLDGRYVFARDLREKNRWLMEQYPDRPAYRFDGEGFRRLVRFRPDAATSDPPRTGRRSSGRGQGKD